MLAISFLGQFYENYLKHFFNSSLEIGASTKLLCFAIYYKPHIIVCHVQHSWFETIWSQVHLTVAGTTSLKECYSWYWKRAKELKIWNTADTSASQSHFNHLETPLMGPNWANCCWRSLPMTSSSRGPTKILVWSIGSLTVSIQLSFWDRRELKTNEKCSYVMTRGGTSPFLIKSKISKLEPTLSLSEI